MPLERLNVFLQVGHVTVALSASNKLPRLYNTFLKFGNALAANVMEINKTIAKTASITYVVIDNAPFV
ncbi:hypothetical protein NQG63_14615 [Exiguobacterium himgiriensis]|nr:hypothetical protein [Exiguobacterium himgiriensis]